MKIRIYKRRSRRKIGARRCLHWDHIRKRKGLWQKILYITNRLQGNYTPIMFFSTDPCFHKGDGASWHTIPVSTRLTDYQPNNTRNSTKDFVMDNTSEFKSWLDKAICVEIVIHNKNNKPLCLDCQRYWDSWTEEQRRYALALGQYEYIVRYGLADDGKSKNDTG